MIESGMFPQLSAMTQYDGPSGFEEPVLQMAQQELTPFCERIEVDLRGNLYGLQSAKSSHDAGSLKIMITAHADQIGFLITKIRPDGFLRFTKLGGPSHQVLPGHLVRLLTPDEAIEGVIGVKPGHILTSEESRQLPSIDDMYIDIGASSEEEARSWGIEVGTPAVFGGELKRTKNPNRVFGRSVDNRAGMFALVEIARMLHSREVPSDCYYVVTVEEEIGLRGAEVAARKVEPHIIIAIDTVPAGGTPDLHPDQLPWEIGKGPLIKVRETSGLSTHPQLRSLVLDVAQQQKIPVQLIVDTAGITDASSAQQSHADVAAITIGLARRYSHSAVEMFDLQDLDQIIKLVSHTVPLIHSKKQFLRL